MVVSCGLLLRSHALLLVFVLGCESCGRGSIRIENNGYKGILIAIGDQVAEDTNLIDKIKTVFTEASELLYSATRHRSFFEEITILVPSSWDSNFYNASTSEAFDKSDIVVAPDELGKGDHPFTIKTTPCGELGHYMRLTPGFFTNESILDQFGSYDKIILHEWAHLRYGVFDEYPSGSVSQFYAETGGKIEGVRCSKDITGRMVNKVSGEPCKFDSNMPEDDCVFVDDESTQPETGLASLMYKSFINQVTSFCDSDSDSSSLTRHNSNAPTDQNRLCNGQSVWEVLDKHQDFVNGSNPAREINNTVPRFKVVQPKSFRTVLVLDKSGSMLDFNRLDKLRQGCYNYITNIIQDDEYLGIVWFDSTAMAVKNLTQVNNTREELLDALPDDAFDSTSIGGGIQVAVDMLNVGDDSAKGGSIIVVTDGQENVPPYLLNIIDQIQEAEVTIHSIAISEAADLKLDLLAVSTGGLSFAYSGSDNSNAINEAFFQIGQLNSDPTERHYVIRSKAIQVASNANLSETILIDSSLGRSLQFIFDYNGSAIVPSVTSPTDVIYQASDVAFVTHDASFGIYQFTILNAEQGEWRYTVLSDESQSLAVTVKAQSAIAGQYPIVASIHWGKRSIESIEPNVQNPTQELYASVSQGYSPVLNADVVATVERPDQSAVNVTLLDNGAGADSFANDGIYTAYFTQFNGDGRHGVKVSVGSTDATILSTSRIIGRPVASRYENTETAVTVPVNNVSRNEAGESFRLGNFPGSEGDKYYDPAKISDLVVVSASYENQTVTLQWTAVGDQLDIGQASSYDLRIGTDVQAMTSEFHSQSRVLPDMVESGNLSQPSLAGQLETLVISVPSKGAVTYVFGVKAVDTDGRNVSGPLSNIATISMENFSIDDGDQLSRAWIIIISTGAALALVTVCIVLAVVFIREQIAKAKVPRDNPHTNDRRMNFQSFRPSFVDLHHMHGRQNSGKKRPFNNAEVKNGNRSHSDYYARYNYIL